MRSARRRLPDSRPARVDRECGQTFGARGRDRAGARRACMSLARPSVQGANVPRETSLDPQVERRLAGHVRAPDARSRELRSEARAGRGSQDQRDGARQRRKDTFSVNTSRTSRAGDAPRADRMANSRWRPVDTASRRLATLAQTSSSRPPAARSINRTVGISATRVRGSIHVAGSSRTPRGPSSRGYAASRPAARVRSSTSPCARLTPPRA